MQNILVQEYFWNSILAVIACAAGLIAIGSSFFQRGRNDLSLVTFGTTSFLYGTRLLIATFQNQYIFSTPPLSLFYLNAFCTYIIPVPLSGFILSLFGKGWKNSMLWTLRGSMVFAITGILSDLLQKSPGSMMSVNNALVILWAIIVIINTFSITQKITKELRIVLFGFSIFGLFAVNENLVQLNLLPWRWHWEELGFLVFLGTLGYVSTRRFFDYETRLQTIERELEIARQIQFSILPKTLPSIQGYEITAQYIPMTSVAGDFYDVLFLDKKRFCVLVADVSGHGIGAALIASMIKVAFSSQKHVLHDPAKVLSGINNILIDKLETNFVTAICLFVDDNKIQFSSAGHPPLIIYQRKEQKLLEICEPGLMLGPFPEAEYKNTTVPIESGDRLILYTDGIIEASNTAGLFYGNGFFKDFIETNSNISSKVFASNLISHLSQWSGKPLGESFDDDLTLVIIDKL